MILKPSASVNEHHDSHKRSDQTVQKVTQITKQQKRQDRYSIYINEKYSFSLSEYQLASARLFIGKTFTPAELEAFRTESEFGKAYERTLNYVMIRPRSRGEVNDYLTRTFLYPKPKIYTDKSGVRQFVKQAVNKAQAQAMTSRIMERLEQKGYINDEVFAKAWVSSRQLTKKTSKRKLEQELRAKAIDTEIIATVLQNQNEIEKDNLRAVMTKKRRLPKYQDDMKLTQYLLRQGFNYDDIKSELNQSE